MWRSAAPSFFVCGGDVGDAIIFRFRPNALPSPTRGKKKVLSDFRISFSSALWAPR